MPRNLQTSVYKKLAGHDMTISRVIHTMAVYLFKNDVHINSGNVFPYNLSIAAKLRKARIIHCDFSGRSLLFRQAIVCETLKNMNQCNIGT
jgi:hypothetical protein